MPKHARVTVAAPWGNRIVGTGSVPAGQLLANPANWRIHPAFQQEQLGTSLQRVGFVQTVIVNRRTDAAWGHEQGVETVVDGHLRVSLALSRGEETPVPVSYVDLSPDEERWVLATFDPIGALAAADREQVTALLGSMDADDAALAAVLHAERKAAKKLVAFDATEAYEVVVLCGSVAEQQALLTRLQGEGLTCRTN